MKRKSHSKRKIKQEGVLIDPASLKEFINNNRLVKLVDDSISNGTQYKLVKDVIDFFIPIEIRNLKYLGIETIKELEDVLSQYKENVTKFTINYFLINKSQHVYNLPISISIYYLIQYLVLKRSNIEELKKILKNETSDSEYLEKWANDLIQAYNQSEDVLSGFPTSRE